MYHVNITASQCLLVVSQVDLWLLSILMMDEYDRERHGVSEMSVLRLPQDIQGEAPSHLIRLKVDVERNHVADILEDIRAELDREMRSLSDTCTSEQMIKEHRVSRGFSGITSLNLK